MKFKKKYAAAAVISIVVIINIAATLRLLYAVAYPERIIKEQVTEYFKATLDKAVKFEDLYIDACGNLILSYFNVSVTSDFNDNISLVRSTTTKISLDLPGLFTGNIRVRGIDFYDSDITLIKKYGRSHRECFISLLDPDRLLARIKNSSNSLRVGLHGSRIFYRESLRDRQVSLELYKVKAELNIDPGSVSYSARGKIKPYKTEILRRGSFYCEGKVDIGAGASWGHRIEVENFDLTYLNDHIAEYKIAGVSLSGAVSVDARFGERKGVLSLAGRAEANSLTIASIEKKYDLLSGENMDIDLDMTIDTVSNRYTVRRLSLNDGVVSLDASGMYVRNDKDDAVKLKFKTNVIDLADLSQTLTPLKYIEYEGTLQCDGSFSLDFKKKTAPVMRAGLLLDEFTLLRKDRGKTETLIGETSMRVKVDGSSIDVDIKGKPLNSDVAVKGKTVVESWFPLKTNTNVSVRSKRMNSENFRLALLYLANSAYESAYDDKRSGREKIPFSQRPLGKFMNNNSIDFNSAYDTVFFGKRAELKHFVLNARLSNGAATIHEFGVEGYDATYMLSGSGYFNSDQPYVKIDGKIDEFELGRFFAESGMSGSLSGKAHADFSYEVSISRIGDILDNARGSLNIRVGRGELKHTQFQRDLMAFLAKMGQDTPSIAMVNFEDITLSMTEQGENFWFSNLGIRGDTLIFNIAGDYLFEGGINTTFGMLIKKETGMVTVPLHMHGPILAPCIDASDKKDSPKLCL